MEAKIVYTAPADEVFDHAVIIERDLQAGRIAQENDPTNLAPRKMPFQRAAEKMSRERAKVLRRRHAGFTIGTAERGRGIGCRRRIPICARLGVIDQMMFDRRASGLGHMQQKMDGRG